MPAITASNFLKRKAGIRVSKRRRELALRLHLLAQGVREIDIEANGLIFAVGGDKRWIGRGGAKMERLG